MLNKFDLLVSNDLDTLIPNFLISKLKGLPLVYDSHEYFTGVPEIQNRPFVKLVWSRIEKLIVPRLKFMITVSGPIALLYEEMYGVKPLIVRNVGKNCGHIIPFSRKELGFAPGDLLLIISGTGINIDKGAEELIHAINISESIALMVVGSGDVVPELKRIVNELNIGFKVKFFEPVPWETLMKYTKAADAGLCLEKNTNLNYKFSLPNKLFDYIAAGIPVIAGNLPETGKIIRDYGCGLIIKEITPEKIADAMNELKADPHKLNELRKGVVVASANLNWKSESEKVLKFYKKVLKMDLLR